MGDRGGLSWEKGSFYSESQVSGVMRSLGIDIAGETESVFLAHCPFHGGRDTPSFAVNRSEGTYICFNPACGKSGGLMYLVKTIGRLNDFQARRLILKNKLDSSDVVNQLESLVELREDWPAYDPAYFDRVKTEMWEYAEPQIYMRDRGFEKQTLKDFEVGYDSELDMVCVPMHDPKGRVEVGAIRRSIKGKTFKNTPGLPSANTLFNLHRALRTGDSVIIVEASFDVMKLHQSGYPNAVACLMGHFNKQHALLLGRYFDTITIMTDFDDKSKNVYKNCIKCSKNGSGLCVGHNPGEELGHKIANLLTTKRIMWAHHGGSSRFPEGVKDPGDMDEELIRHSIKNSVGHFEYIMG